MAKKSVIKQLDMFGEPEIVKAPRKRMSDKEKQERKEKRDIQKKLKQEKEFEDYWKEHGYTQGYLFDDNGEIIDEQKIQNIIKEEVERFIKEETSGIKIKPENKGKFTATKERTGKTTEELLKSPNKKTRARANFARMAKRGWKKLKK